MSIKVVDLIKNTETALFSFELLPPLKGDSIDSVYRTIDPLMEFKPPYINITYHQEEVVYKRIRGNLVEMRTIWKRPGTVALSAAIKYKYKVAVVPHLICGGFSREDTEYALIDLNFLDIRNLLAVRGDPVGNSKKFVPHEQGHQYALSLLEQIMNMNKGRYLDEDIQFKTPTNFSVGVAGYPEKHPESPNLESDLHFLKKKIDAGAEFIVTQMFYDNQKFFKFVNDCRETGINVPIIPGLKPISNMQHLNSLPKTFNIDVPEALVKEALKCKSNEKVRQVGIEWGIQQSRELVKFGVPVIHYYTMGSPDNIHSIARAVF